VAATQHKRIAPGKAPTKTDNEVIVLKGVNTCIKILK
jgi:hypothetical protein